jgi:two-component system invasion response regulator UvrY
MHLSAAMTLKAFEAGASGFVTKSSGPAELIRAVSSVAAGGRALSSDVSEVVAADRLTSSTQILTDLSPRETEILQLLARGMESEEIAELLHLSPKTVRNHHYTIKAKIGARNDAQLVWLALGAGLVAVEAVEPPGLADS